MEACSPLAPVTASASGTRRPGYLFTLFLGIPIGSVASRGHQMDACSPPAPLTAPSASGMQRQGDKYARLKAIQALLLPYPSQQMVASLPRNPTMERFGSGTLMFGKQ